VLKGTYIRTLGEDIGKKLGCGATMTALCREKIGPFAVDAAIDANDSEAFNKEKIINKMISEKDLARVFKEVKE
jgi:tRNA pseudouridine55 synthase